MVIPYHALQPDKRHHTHTSCEMQTRSTVNSGIPAPERGFREPSKASCAGLRGLDLKSSKSYERPPDGHTTARSQRGDVETFHHFFDRVAEVGEHHNAIARWTSSGVSKRFEKRDRNCGNSTSRRSRCAELSESHREFFPPRILSPRHFDTFTAAQQARSARRVAQSAGIAEQHS